MMKCGISFALLATVVLGGLMCVGSVHAGVLALYDWRMPADSLPEGCTLVAPGGNTDYSHLIVALNDAEGNALRREFLTIESPGICERTYLIKSMVRVTGARGCVVTLRSIFPDGSEKTTGKYVSMRMLNATSGPTPWLTFMINVAGEENSEPPVRLVVGCEALPGRKGAVQAEFRPLVLAQLSPDELAMQPGDWWSPSAGRNLTVAATALLLTLGVGIGLLCGLVRALRVAVVVSYSGLIVGLVLLILGGVALAASQPGMVAVPILLGGALASLLFGILGAISRRKYANAMLEMEDGESEPVEHSDGDVDTSVS